MSFRETPTQIRELKIPDDMAYVGTTPRTMAPCWTASADLHCREWTFALHWMPTVNDPSVRNLERVCHNFGGKSL